MRTIVFAILFVLGVPAHGALVDNGAYTSDTLSGLEWLDLSETNNMTMVDALAANSGWRFATNAEIEGLFAQSFVGYYETNATGYSRVAEGAYTNQQADMDVFVSLFGATRIAGSAIESLGWYLDETATVRLLGTYEDINNSDVYGPGLIYSYDQFYDSNASISIGTFLVRSSVVPLPAAIWLFGSALAGLGWIRRKQAV